MPTPEELRAAIAKGRADFKAAIEAAGDNWERKPSPGEGAGEGEASWSAREAAEHTIDAEAWFATEACRACGYPGIDAVESSSPTAAAAVQAFDEVSAKADGRLKYITEKDLETAHEQMKTVAGLLDYNAQHLQEHAAQIRAAAGA